jgi:RNA-binding protein YlmH
MTREEILARYSGEDKALASRVFDWALEAIRQNDYRLSDFLDPRELDLAAGLLKQFPGLRWHAFGGYPGAERKRVAITPDYFSAAELDWKLGAAGIEGDFREEPPTHRDYLGALLNLGLKREKLGDLLVSPEGCQVVATADLVQFICQQLERVGRWRVTVRILELERLTPPQQTVKQIRTTVASLRLDAVASSGFGLSRTKLVRLIRSGAVKVNWQPTQDQDKIVSQGDVISLRGKGRLTVAEVGGLTKKNRQILVLERYL